jgi:pimeloyl-ACP methyl ester carboxylesterase
MDYEQIILKDGHILAYKEYGDLNGYPIIHAHGGPGSKLEGILFHDKAKEYGFRFIVPDRPGYGHSTFKKDRLLTDYPLFISKLADHLNIKNFAVSGWSGGGSHVLAAAHALFNRIDFAIAIAGYTQMDFKNAYDLLPKADRFAASIMEKHPLIFRSFFFIMAMMIKYFPNMFYRALYKSASKDDQYILDDKKLKTFFIEEMQDAVRQGSKGVELDARIEYQKHWGFQLEDIKTPLIVMQGADDTLVPKAFAKDIVKRVPNSKLILLEGKGHMFPVTCQDLIFQRAKESLEHLHQS